MANPIFQQQPGNNSPIDGISAIRSMLSGNPEQLYNQMYQSNPQFRQFADSMQGKSIEQAYSEYGQDPGRIRNLLGI